MCKGVSAFRYIVLRIKCIPLNYKCALTTEFVTRGMGGGGGGGGGVLRLFVFERIWLLFIYSILCLQPF